MRGPCPYWFGDVTGMSYVPMPVAADIAKVAGDHTRDLLAKASSLCGGDSKVHATSMAVQGPPGTC